MPMTAGQRGPFERDRYLIIRGALTPDETAAARHRSGPEASPAWRHGVERFGFFVTRP
jgi:hypothetical protein